LFNQWVTLAVRYDPNSPADPGRTGGVIGRPAHGAGMTTISEPTKPTNESENSAEKADLEVKKLRLETEKLEREATWFGRLTAVIVPMSVALITAFVAVLGVVVATGTLIQQGLKQRVDIHNQSLRQALSMATDHAGGKARSVSGIYQLREFWEEQDDEQVVAATLTALLAEPDTTEGTSVVRCAAAEVIGSAYASEEPAKSIRDDPRVLRIARLLYGNADGSLGLVSRENYMLRRARESQRKAQTGVPASPSGDTEDSLTATLNCLTPLASTREAIRKNWTNLRQTNLQYTDLAFSQFYEADLGGALLTGADLHGATLRCANLLEAKLEGILVDATTETTLVNTGVANPPTFPNAISIPDNLRQDWKRRGFTMSALKALLGTNFPRWASNYDEHFCQE